MVRDGEAVLLLPSLQLLGKEASAKADEAVADRAVEPVAVYRLRGAAAVVALRAMVGAVQHKAIEIPLTLQVVEASVDRGLVAIHRRDRKSTRLNPSHQAT